MDINYLALKNDKDGKDFLKFIDIYPNKTQYVRIQILNWKNEPLKENYYIQGRVTGGNISLNASSAVRRTGTISLIVSEEDTFYKVTNIDNLLSINKKIKIEIGIDLDILPYENSNFYKFQQYDRIWYPLGIFVIKNPSLNRSISGVVLSLSLSDQMCLLNGEMGGNLPAPVIFSETDVVFPSGSVQKEYTLVQDIIKTVVNQYGGIPIEKIKIKDVAKEMKQVMKWSGEKAIYADLTEGKLYKEDPENGNKIKQIIPGQDACFKMVPFTWPGEALSANAGETITSVLDKIKNLGNYEYFFDVEGNFVWQEKNTYKYDSTSISPELFFNDIFDNEKIDDVIFSTINTTGDNVPETYDFTGDAKSIIISYSNSPQYNNFKNDFIIWGKRKNSSNEGVPIRYHIAFDEKYPDTNINSKELYIVKYENDLGRISYKVVENIDKNSVKPQFNLESKKIVYCIRDDDKNDRYWGWNEELNGFVVLDLKVVSIEKSNWRNNIYLIGDDKKTYFEDPFYKELKMEWPKLYNPQDNKWSITQTTDYDTIDYYCHIINGDENKNNNLVKINKSSIGKYLTKVVKDDSINCIYAPDVPAILLTNDNFAGEGWTEEEKVKFFVGGSYNSAFELARQLICQYTSYANTISLSAIPIFYLEPNNFIKVQDKETDIDGDYVINTISIPLAHSGNMTISASKAKTN